MSKYRNAIVVSGTLALIVGFMALAGYHGSRERAEAERIEAEKAAKVASIEAEEIAKIDMARKRNFRDTYWGMTRLQVKASEKWHHRPVLSGKDYLYYEGEILNEKCGLYYSFQTYYTDDKTLSMAWYSFRDLSEKTAQALRILIGPIIAKKYGRYHSESNTYNKDTKRSEYIIKWMDAETMVTLTYKFPEKSWDKNGYDVSISYTSIEAEKKSEEKRKELRKASQERKAREATRLYKEAATNF